MGKRIDVDPDVGLDTAMGMMQERSKRRTRTISRVTLDATQSGMKTLVAGIQRMHRKKEKQNSRSDTLKFWGKVIAILLVLAGIAFLVFRLF